MSNEQSIELKQDSRNSVVLKKDARGNYNWEIKLYFDEKAPIGKLQEIDDALKINFGAKDV